MSNTRRGIAQSLRAALLFGPVFVNDAAAINRGGPWPGSGRGWHPRKKTPGKVKTPEVSVPPARATGKVRQSCSTEAPEFVTPPFDGGVGF